VTCERAARLLEINERQVRKYLEAASPIPTTIFDALPGALSDEFAVRIGVGKKSSAEARFRTALADLERVGASSDLLLEGMARLGALSAHARRTGR